MRAYFVALALAVAAAPPAAAHELTAGDLTIVHPSSRPAMAGRPGVAYMAIVNDGAEAERLLGARAPGFAAVELHESYQEGGVSRMRPVEALAIPAGDTGLLQPGALHFMLLGGEQALKAGGEFPLILQFERAGEVEIEVMVDDHGSAPAAGHSGHSGHSGHADHIAPAQQ